MSVYISEEYILHGKAVYRAFPQLLGEWKHLTHKLSKRGKIHEKFTWYLSTLFLILELTTAFYDINSLVNFPSCF